MPDPNPTPAPNLSGTPGTGDPANPNPDPAKPGTVLNADPAKPNGGDPPVPVAGKWPDDWRQQ